jgi:mannose-6-phosphate isomerase-like protein (cupin superfamily)
MKTSGLIISTAIVLLALLIMNTSAKQAQSGYILEHEKDIAREEGGPHEGLGKTTAHSFFATTSDSKLIFRKRILQPGSSIGYHLQKWEEIYYIVSGKGEMQMNGKTFPVEGGDAILTYPGNSHGLIQQGNQDLVVIINYNKEK